MMDACNAAFRDLANNYVKVRNIIPNDTSHIFLVSSVGPDLDTESIYTIIKQHQLTIEHVKVETIEGSMQVEVQVSCLL